MFCCNHSEMYQMFCVVISGLTFVWVLSSRSWNSVAFIEASLEELPVRAKLGPSCLAMEISAPGPSLLGGSATTPPQSQSQYLISSHKELPNQNSKEFKLISKGEWSYLLFLKKKWGKKREAHSPFQVANYGVQITRKLSTSSLHTLQIFHVPWDLNWLSTNPGMDHPSTSNTSNQGMQPSSYP